MENQINVGDQHNQQGNINSNVSPTRSRVNYWMISTIVLLFVVLLELFLLNKEKLLSGPKCIQLTNNINSSKKTSFFDDENLEWKTITSERAKFSFKYPSTWPIDFESEEELKIDQSYYDENSPDDMYDIENVDFTEKWYRNAGGERYGFIAVRKQKGITTLDDYVKYIDKETEIWAKGVTTKIPRPKIKYSVIGGDVAVTEYPQDAFARLDSPNVDLNFIVVRNGLIYRFAAFKSDRFMQNEEQSSKVFREIISSVKFLD